MKGAAGRKKSVAICICGIAVLLFISPNSPYVLCVSPTGHVAVESVAGLCCLSSDAATMPATHDLLSFEQGASSDECRGCIDLLITQYALSAVACASTTDCPVGECAADRLTVNACFPAAREARLPRMMAASVAISPSAPLRC